MGQDLTISAILLILFFSGILISVLFFGKLLDFITEKTSGRGIKNGPWKTHLGVGRKETPGIEKAAIARIGLGANDSDETIYWNAFVDSNEEGLHSSNNYRIIFKAKPLVDYENKGFWSITVYGSDKFLVPNPDKKYVMRSNFNYELNDDQSFSIFLSVKKPGNHSNWLPLPSSPQKFSIALRCYIPGEEMKKNSELNVMPSIIKI